MTTLASGLHVDDTALAEWNAAQETAKAAYDEHPSAWSEFLTTVCARCMEGRHWRCRRTWRGRPVRCGCRTRKHPGRAWWG